MVSIAGKDPWVLSCNRCGWSMFKIKDNEFKLLSDFIRINYGIQLKEEKRALITGRLYKVLLEKNFNNFFQYYDYVINDKTGDAVLTLVDKITTNHTYFMREADHFYYLRDNVLPYLKKTIKDKDLRIWSAGCSTGQEPYTLAMVIDEFFGRDKVLWDTKVLATDISNKVLKKAIEGVYDIKEVVPLPARWRLNYFKRLDKKSCVIADEIKSEVIFRKFNLMDSAFPFKKKFHIIFCRNVMIYFGNIIRTELINKFYDSTEYGGYLFVGHSESLNREKCGYKYVMPGVYRKELKI